MATNRALVLGAGFQGVCVALGLARRGFAVTLVDQSGDCMQRASLRNEGKIHLGLVYANDPSFRTAAIMIRASLEFAPLVDGWLGEPLDWSALCSRPFTYVIARDSMLSASQLFAHYEKVNETYRQALNGSGTSYLGRRPARLWEELPASEVRGLDEGFAVGAVATAELALDLVRFRRALRTRLHALDAIERLYAHRIESVARTAAGFRVEGVRDGMTWSSEADVVVNCLWEGRLRLDEQVAQLPRRRWMHRLKYRVLGELPEDLGHLPSLTIVLGRYGDLVVYPSRRVYLSWYPACMKGHSADLTIPPSWEAACDGNVAAREANIIARDTLTGFDAVVPGLALTRIDVVDAGVIFAWGESDIDDPDSELHQRFEIGVHSDDGYYSVDTGKLTCAPLFAQQVVDSLR